MSGTMSLRDLLITHLQGRLHAIAQITAKSIGCNEISQLEMSPVLFSCQSKGLDCSGKFLKRHEMKGRKNNLCVKIQVHDD